MDELIKNFNSHNIKEVYGRFKFFGLSLGRPYDDNMFELKDIKSYFSGVFILEFDGGILTLWNPEGVSFRNKVLEIKNASKIKWEWHLYGREKTKENYRFWFFEPLPLLHFLINVKSNDSFLKPGIKINWYENAFEIY